MLTIICNISNFRFYKLERAGFRKPKILELWTDRHIKLIVLSLFYFFVVFFVFHFQLSSGFVMLNKSFVIYGYIKLRKFNQRKWERERKV